MLDPLMTIRDLNELIEALDRRSPQLQRHGEADILNAATRLRIQARDRIAELEATRAAQQPIRHSADPTRPHTASRGNG